MTAWQGYTWHRDSVTRNIMTSTRADPTRERLSARFSIGFQGILGFQQVFKALNITRRPPFLTFQVQFSMGNLVEPSARPEDLREKSYAANIPISRLSTHVTPADRSQKWYHSTPRDEPYLTIPYTTIYHHHVRSWHPGMILTPTCFPVNMSSWFWARIWTQPVKQVLTLTYMTLYAHCIPQFSWPHGPTTPIVTPSWPQTHHIPLPNES